MCAPKAAENAEHRPKFAAEWKIHGVEKYEVWK